MYIIELKCSQPAAAAVAQIRAKGYHEKYLPIEDLEDEKARPIVLDLLRNEKDPDLRLSHKSAWIVLFSFLQSPAPNTHVQ